MIYGVNVNVFVNYEVMCCVVEIVGWNSMIR